MIIIMGWFLFWAGSDSCAGVITPINRFAYPKDENRTAGEVAEDYPKFNALIYSLDVFIPLVDLNQVRYWLPNVKKKVKSSKSKTYIKLTSRKFSRWFLSKLTNRKFLRCFFWFQILVGLVLTLLFVAGLTGLVRK